MYFPTAITESSEPQWRADLPRGRQLVTAPWLARLLSGLPVSAAPAPAWRLFEVDDGHWHAGHPGHVPGAAWLDTNLLEHLPAWNRVPDALLLLLRLQALGIRHDTTVVLTGCHLTAAARVAHLLLLAGVTDVRLLDGGTRAWQQTGLPLQYAAPHQPAPAPAADFGLHLPACPHWLIDTAQVRALLAHPDATLVSIRSRGEFMGWTSGYASIPARGDIAGARWGRAGASDDMNCMRDFHTPQGRMKPAAEILRFWRDEGIRADRHAAFYCGTGWRASLAFFYAWLMGWGVAYSATLLLAVVFLGNWLGMVPNAVTAAILVFMASRMVDAGTRRLAVQVLTRRRPMAPEQYRLLMANFSVVVLVALVVVLGDMLKGVAVGVFAAMFLFVRAGMRSVVRSVVTAEQRRSLKVRSLADMQVLATEGRRTAVIEVEGTLFFGTSDQLARAIDAIAPNTQWLILDLQRVSDVDPTGAHNLLLAARRLHTQHRSLSLAGATPRVEQVLKAMGLESTIAPVHWYDDLDTALEDHEDTLLRRSGASAGVAPLSFLQTSLADGLTYQQGKLLQSHLTRRACESGEVVFYSGDSGSSLFVTTGSVVDILLPLENGKSRRVASFAPGVVFGEMALLDGKPRSADAVINGTGTLWEPTRDSLSEIEQHHPDIAHCIHLSLSRSLAERLRLTTLELRIATRK